MEKEQETIEVEVVEIDGIAPVPVSHPREDEDPRQGWNDWQNWQGRVRQLDMRWWPLWALLGIILVFLLLTIGVALGALYIIYRIIRGFLSAIAGAFKG